MYAVVEDKLLVADLADPCQSERYASVGLVASHAEPEVREPELDRLGDGVVGESVGDLLLGDGEPRLMRRGFGLAELDGAGLRSRQGQRHNGIACIRRYIERRRRRELFGDGERRAIRQHSGGLQQAEFAEACKILVNGDGGKAPCVRLDAVHPGANVGVEVSLLGLEVLGPEEHSLAPRYAVLTGHAQAPMGPLVKHSFSSSESWDIVPRSRVADTGETDHPNRRRQ